MGAYDDSDPVPVRLHFTPKVAPFIAERPWHETTRFERLPRWRSDAPLHVAHTPELEAFVLRWAGNVDVLEPAGLRQRMHEVGEARAAAHRG